MAYNSALQRYTMIVGEGVVVAYSESADGLHWTPTVLLFDFRNEKDQPTTYMSAPVGEGEDPGVLGKQFYVFYTRYPTTGAGWTGASVNRFTVSCQ